MSCSRALSRAFNKRLSESDTVEELNERKGQNIEKVGSHRNFPGIEVYALVTLFDFHKNKNDDELGIELMEGINMFEESIMFGIFLLAIWPLQYSVVGAP